MMYTNSNLPAQFKGLMPRAVNDLLELNYSDREVIALLKYADDHNDHPDWSEATDEEVALHFKSIAQTIAKQEDDLALQVLTNYIVFGDH